MKKTQRPRIHPIIHSPRTGPLGENLPAQPAAFVGRLLGRLLGGPIGKNRENPVTFPGADLLTNEPVLNRILKPLPEKPPMKSVFHIPLVGLAITALGSASLHAATSFTENFDASTTLPTGWVGVNNIAVIDNADYSVSGTNTLWIVETRNSNVVTTPTINLAGAKEATISFLWTTDVHSSKFGRVPQIQYSSDGTIFETIGSLAVPANTAAIPDHTTFSQTIDTSGGHLFTTASVFRIVGDNDGGGAGGPLIIDDFSVTSDATIPEPSTALLGALGLLALLRRRR